MSKKFLCSLIGITGDVSQKGNWTCFRNESLNDEPLEINSTFARELPKTGIVKFDYSYSARPSRLKKKKNLFN